MESKQVQKAGENSRQIQAETIIINQGITEQRVREIIAEMSSMAIKENTIDAESKALERISKLEELKIPMDNNYEETLKLNEKIKNRIKEIAPECNAEPSNLITAYEAFTRFEVHDKSETSDVIWGNERKLFSSKPYNISFRLHAALIAVIDQGFAISKAEGRAESVFCVLRIIIELIGLSAIKLSKEQANLIVICHENRAYNQPINEDELLDKANVSHEEIDELAKMKCISIENGEVWLAEEVLL